nr:hypothetical protein [Tanacetum cinerariifolium]
MIASSGLNLHCKVADVIINGEWNWPMNLSNMFDALNVISPPYITEGRNDKVVWKSYNGRFLDFSVSNVWESIRRHGTLVSWSNLVWFSQCIPRHSFVLWLAMHGKLKTQDNMLHGDRNDRLLYTLCGKIVDSHDHLFFDCNFPNGIWDSLKNMERNLRLFQNRRRSKEELCHIIKDMVRLRVLSLSLKPSVQVYEAADIWSFHVCNDIGSKRVKSITDGYCLSLMNWAFFYLYMRALGLILLIGNMRDSSRCPWSGVQIGFSDHGGVIVEVAMVETDRGGQRCDDEVMVMFDEEMWWGGDGWRGEAAGGQIWWLVVSPEKFRCKVVIVWWLSWGGGEGGDEWRLVARWRRGRKVRLEMMTMRGWCRIGALLHNATSQDTRERPPNVSFENGRVEMVVRRLWGVWRCGDDDCGTRMAVAVASC